jgi:hypothetical protein
MNYLVIDTNKYNYKQYANGVFFAIPIINGPQINKFACFENYIELFPEVLSVEPYKKIDLNNSVFLPDFNAPKLSIYGVEIPIEYRWIFANDEFVLSGFIIPLNNYELTKIVNLAYFEWVDFRNELDKKDENGNFVYEALKRSLMPLWDYVALQVQNGNIIVV